MIDDRRLRAIVTRHHLAQLALARTIATAIGASWARIRTLDDQALDEWVAAATLLVGTAQAKAVDLTDTYLAQYLTTAFDHPVAPLEIDPAEILAQLRSGAAPAEIYTRPFITARARGFDAGRARALATADTDLQLAFRTAATTLMAARPEITGYHRVPNTGACPLCLSASGHEYSTSDLMPIHNHCHCTVAPIVGNHSLSFARPAPAGTDTAIHEHGELGPVLTPAGQTFTGPGDF